MKKVLIVAGDPSGDLIASKLVESMKKIQPDLYVIGMGGDRLQKVSDHFLKNIVSQHALGFAISPRKLRFFHEILTRIIEPELNDKNLDAVIPVDFYGFNSRVAHLAKKKGKKVFYYVSPQFWASRSGRADGLRNVVDMFLCLFPFEIDFYQKKKLPAKFVGHPILDTLPDISATSVRPPKVESIIGLMPGSRPEEIKRHLPVMLDACDIIYRENPGIRLMLFTVPHISRHLYNKLLKRLGKSKMLIDLVQDENYLWRSQIDLAITASGMETLENALLGIPMVIIYKTNWITYWIAKMLIQIPFLGMPNLLSKQSLVPEYIQTKARGKTIAQPLLRWLKNPTERSHIRRQLLELRDKLGKSGASERAARVILEKVA